MGGIMSTLTCPADRGPTRNDGTTTNSKLEFDGVDLEAAYPPTHRTDNTKYEEGYKANAKQEHKCDHPIHKEVNISVTDPTMIRKCDCMEHSSENNGHGSNYVPQPSSINTANHLPLTSEELKLHLGTDVSAPFKPILKILQVSVDLRLENIHVEYVSILLYILLFRKLIDISYYIFYFTFILLNRLVH